MNNIAYLIIKRLIDIFISVSTIILFLPFFIIVSIVIRLETKGPSFFIQERYGLNKKKIKIIKFRTMYFKQKNNNISFADEKKDEITKFGYYLRKFRIDEFPQLFNVLSGNMTIVGPRPEQIFFAEKFCLQLDNYEKRFTVKPGLTGLAQITSGYAFNLATTEIKTKYDIQYIDNQSIYMDLCIIFKTIPIVIFGKGL